MLGFHAGCYQQARLPLTLALSVYVCSSCVHVWVSVGACVCMPVYSCVQRHNLWDTGPVGLARLASQRAPGVHLLSSPARVTEEGPRAQLLHGSRGSEPGPRWLLQRETLSPKQRTQKPRSTYLFSFLMGDGVVGGNKVEETHERWNFLSLHMASGTRFKSLEARA